MKLTGTGDEVTDGGQGGQFVSEPIQPLAGTADAAAMACGEPGLPAGFTWRGRPYCIVELLRKWKGTAPEGGRPGGRIYLRRHWYAVRVDGGQLMTLYCERQARRANPKARWFLYTVSE